MTKIGVTSQAATSIILKEARENIGTEPVQLTIEEKISAGSLSGRRPRFQPAGVVRIDEEPNIARE